MLWYFSAAASKAQPSHPDANHNIGVLGVGVGKIEQALPFFKKALDVNPKAIHYIQICFILCLFDNLNNHKKKSTNITCTAKIRT